jgi:glycosyltransferase involved in cell wall biosynthesis
MTATISILMPVKNTAPFLAECLDSILAQTETDWELLAIDDHSDDDSPRILAAYAAADSRIRTFPSDGTGIIEALRTAHSRSAGQLITRMDSDDVMSTDKLAVLKRKLLGAGSGHIALGQVDYFSDSKLGEGYRNYAKWLNALTTEGRNFDDLYRECVIPSPCWMLYRDDLERCGAFRPDRYPEDYDLCFRFYANGLICIPCNDVIHRWRDYPTRTSRTDAHYADNSFLDIKLHYFLDVDYEGALPLVLWGAGRKGKRIAELLSAGSVPFAWLCNNPRKIGQTIYGQLLQDDDMAFSYAHPQFIVVVAGDEQQGPIIERLVTAQCSPRQDYFLFC